jgi:hypothetical protein
MRGAATRNRSLPNHTHTLCAPPRTLARTKANAPKPVISSPLARSAHHSGRRQLDYGRSTTFSVSLEGVTETEDGSCRHSLILHDRHYGAHAPNDPRFLQDDLYRTSATNNSLNN